MADQSIRTAINCLHRVAIMAPSPRTPYQVSSCTHRRDRRPLVDVRWFVVDESPPIPGAISTAKARITPGVG
jgi:hypothetical protein